MVSIYECKDPLNWTASEQLVRDFWNNGYVIIRGLFSAEEMDKINQAASTKELYEKAYGLKDREGIELKLALWQYPGNDVLGLTARTDRLVKTVDAIMGGEVYHYHTKLMMKIPNNGGRVEWHQDYGYWYKNTVLYPDLLTAFLAIDKSTKANGCLQVLRGSHRVGRIDHHLDSGQQGADPERVQQVIDHAGVQLVYVEQNPGDCLLFHSNLLHSSDKNSSQDRRYMLSIAYNKRTNNPVKEHHHALYNKLHTVADADLMKCDVMFDGTGKEFIDPTMDKTVSHPSQEWYEKDEQKK